MEDVKPLNQPSRVKQLEQELEQIHQKVAEDYKEVKTHKFFKADSQPNANLPAAETPPANTKDSQRDKPTYLEEEQMVGMAQHIKSEVTADKPTVLPVGGAAGNKMKLVFKVSLILLTIALLVAGGFYLVGALTKNQREEVVSWGDCIQAKGSVIQDSYPRVCVSQDGQRFTELIVVTPTPLATPTIDEVILPDYSVIDSCEIRGCGAELCQDTEAESVYTICEVKPEHSCYKQAVCERQADDECGWTQTAELVNCLAQYEAQ